MLSHTATESFLRIFNMHYYYRNGSLWQHHASDSKVNNCCHQADAGTVMTQAAAIFSSAERLTNSFL